MGCSYAWTDHSVVKTFDGFVSGHDFILSAEAVSADPRFDQLRIIYNDFGGPEFDHAFAKPVDFDRLKIIFDL